MKGERNWIKVEDRLPKKSGTYTVWHGCGLGGKMSRGFFDGVKFDTFPEVYEWMDGYKDS
jgi:hypothetical protein